MCKSSEETVDLLLDCDIAYNLWNFIFSVFGVHGLCLKVLLLLLRWMEELVWKCDAGAEYLFYFYL
jgi:hypothetical protein